MEMLSEVLLDAAIVLLVLLIRRWVVMITIVKGRSMMTTLQPREVYLAWSSPLLYRQPRRGDIVLCHYPGRFRYGLRWWPELFVKRIVGLPGETVALVDGKVLIDGQVLDEPYLNPACCRRRFVMPSKTLGADEYFVMGDHRDNSNDSRSVGPIRRDAIRAVVWRKLLRLPPLPRSWQKISQKMTKRRRKRKP